VTGREFGKGFPDTSRVAKNLFYFDFRRNSSREQRMAGDECIEERRMYVREERIRIIPNTMASEERKKERISSTAVYVIVHRHTYVVYIYKNTATVLVYYVSLYTDWVCYALLIHMKPVHTHISSMTIYD
jgi:hypothetical protein